MPMSVRIVRGSKRKTFRIANTGAQVTVLSWAPTFSFGHVSDIRCESRCSDGAFFGQRGIPLTLVLLIFGRSQNNVTGPSLRQSRV